MGCGMACGMTYSCGMEFIIMEMARLVFGRRWHKFEGATALPVHLLLVAQTNKAEQHVGVHEDY